MHIHWNIFNSYACGRDDEFNLYVYMVIQGDIPIYVKYKSYCDFQVWKTKKLYAVNIYRK